MTVPTWPVLAGQTYPVTRRPMTSTLKQEAVSGFETRVSLYTYARYQWEVKFSYFGGGATSRKDTDWQTFSQFFEQVNGAGGLFLYSDPNDKIVAAASPQATNPGSSTGTVFAFQRALTSTAYSAFQPIFALTTASTFNVYKDGVALALSTASSGFALLTDPNYGLTYGASLVTAPSSTSLMTWSGSYQWPARLDDDQADIENFMNSFFRLNKISFKSAKIRSS